MAIMTVWTTFAGTGGLRIRRLIVWAHDGKAYIGLVPMRSDPSKRRQGRRLALSGLLLRSVDSVSRFGYHGNIHGRAEISMARFLCVSTVTITD
jgi:hypothetical protein